MLKRFFALLTIFLTVTVHGQVSDSIPVLLGTDLPGIRIEQTRSFKGESLYGYIDGGADLYLEYGFSGVTVTNFTKGKRKFKIDVYRMNDAESAFGIFSVSRFRCKSRPGFTDLACLNNYQLQFCRGDYYVSIINESGTPADSTILLETGKILAARISNRPLNLKQYFPNEDSLFLMRGSVLVKGRLGINNGVPDLEAFFRSNSDFKGLVISNTGKFVVSLQFSSVSSLEKFAGIHEWKPLPEIGKSDFMPSGEFVFRKDESAVIIEIPTGR